MDLRKKDILKKYEKIMCLWQIFFESYFNCIEEEKDTKHLSPLVEFINSELKVLVE